jgi:hypothetical protein
MFIFKGKVKQERKSLNYSKASKSHNIVPLTMSHSGLLYFRIIQTSLMNPMP